MTYVRPPQRKTRSIKVTWCPDCKRWVGVQRGQEPGRLSYFREPRVIRHKLGFTEKVCPRSGEALSENLVMDREV